jgi:acyl-CoA synthetase (AMP-forming)/AMP-acid ligase II
MFDANWATLWEHVAAAVPTRPALFHQDTVLSYQELDDRAGRFAATLAAAGVGRGSKVACYLYNCPEYLEAFYATLKVEAVPVNVNYRYQGAELADLLADSDAEVLVFPRSLARHVRDALDRVAPLKLLVQVDDEGDGTPPVAGAVGWAQALADAPLPPQERSGDNHIFMYTGGTTGRPKGVVWRHRDLFDVQRYPTYGTIGREYPTSVQEVVDIAVDMGEAAPRTLPITPLMHATALFSVMDTLLLGGSVVFLPGGRFDPAEVWRLVARHKVTRLIVAGNAVCAPLADELSRARLAGTVPDVSSVRSIHSSGMAWTDDVKRELLAHVPAQLLDILGASEGGPFAYALVGDVSELPSRFRLAAGATVLDDDFEPVPPGSGRVGRLAYAGGMPLGYYRDPEKTAETFREIRGTRYVIPGDYVTVAEDGAIDLLGRGSGVINTGGEKVYPAEVEAVLFAHPAVADCAVVGVPDRRWGEAVTALVVLADAAEPASRVTERDLIEHVGASLAGYKKPKAVLFVDSLNRSPSGKLNMPKLRQRAVDELAAQRSAPSTAR